MSSPPPWVKDGTFTGESPQSPTPSSEPIPSAFTPVESTQKRAFPLDHMEILRNLGQLQGDLLHDDDAQLVRNKKLTPKDHWLVLPPEFEEPKPKKFSKPVPNQEKAKLQSDSNSTKTQTVSMETEFPANNASPIAKHKHTVTAPPFDSTGDKNKSSLSGGKLEKSDSKLTDSLHSSNGKKCDGVSPGQELLKLADSFTEKYTVDPNNGLPHITPQVPPQSGKPDSSSSSKQQVSLMESDSDSDTTSNRTSHDFSCASTVSLNELLEKELDELETPLDDEFSIDNLPIYMVEDISLDDFDDFGDSEPKLIHDQCLVERKFEIRDGILVARNTGKEPADINKSNNNIVLENLTRQANHSNSPSPERPSSLKLGQGHFQRCIGYSDSSENEGKSKKSEKDFAQKDSNKNNSKKGAPPKTMPKPNRKSASGSSAAQPLQKVKNEAGVKTPSKSEDVNSVMATSTISNSSSSPDSAMQASITSTSSSDLGMLEKQGQGHRGDDGYSSNSTMSASLNDLCRDSSLESAVNNLGKFSRASSVDTRSSLSTHSDTPSVVHRSELNGQKVASQSSLTSQSSAERSGSGKVKDMRAYFESRVEELTQEATLARLSMAENAESANKLPENNSESCTQGNMFSSSDSGSMCNSYIKKPSPTSNSVGSSDLSNSQKTLTPQEGESKLPLSPVTKCQKHHNSQCSSIASPLFQSMDGRLLDSMPSRSPCTLKHSISDSRISSPAYLKSLHSRLARVYCLAQSLKVQ